MPNAQDIVDVSSGGEKWINKIQSPSVPVKQNDRRNLHSGVKEKFSTGFFLVLWKTKSTLTPSLGNKRVLISQVLLVKCTWLTDHHQLSAPLQKQKFGSLQVWSFQVCVNTKTQSCQEWTCQQIHPKVRNCEKKTLEVQLSLCRPQLAC